MTMTTRKRPVPPPSGARDGETAEATVGKAPRRRLAWCGAVVGAAILSFLGYGLSGGWAGTSGSEASATVPPAVARSANATTARGVVKMLGCSGKTVYKPATFVVTCADGNTMLTETHWTSWTAAAATGRTRFGLNLCNPYCAASKMSFFPHSTVRLWRPVSTKHGRLFSEMRVVYVLHGKTKVLAFSWLGDPSFLK
jgi:hypothetical protein